VVGDQRLVPALCPALGASGRYDAGMRISADELPGRPIAYRSELATPMG
jgi:hypothetical protein